MNLCYYRKHTVQIIWAQISSIDRIKQNNKVRVDEACQLDHMLVFVWHKVKVWFGRHNAITITIWLRPLAEVS